MECYAPAPARRVVRYYIACRPVDAADLLELVRGHWGVENGLYRTLDCSSGRTIAACARATGPP